MSKDRYPLRLLGLLALLLATCSPHNLVPVEYEREVMSPDGLVKLRSYRNGATYVHPGTRLGDYSKILIEPVQVAYKDPSSPRGSRNPLAGGPYELSEQQTQQLRRTFQHAFEKTVAKSEIWTLAETPASDTLRVRAFIIDLVVEVPPERAGRNRTYRQQSAEMTLILDVSDSATHEALARMRDHHLLGTNSGGRHHELRLLANNGGLRALFGKWARLLTASLEELHELPEIAPLPRSGERGREIAAG